VDFLSALGCKISFACSQVETLAIEVSSLMEFASGMDGYDTLQKLVSSVSEWDGKQIQDMLQKGVKMYLHTLSRNEVMYVPIGYIMVEKAARDQNLVYGMRKSFMAKSEAGRCGYDRLRALFQQSGREVDRMTKILELMDA
jgi:hypothetical protein